MWVLIYVINCLNQNPKPNPNSKISFEGLKENLRLGEGVYRDFKKEFPFLRSNTFVGSKIIQCEGSDRFEKIKPKADKLVKDYGEGIVNIRELLKVPYYNNLEEFVVATKKLVSKYGFANCAEQTDIVQNKLLKKGEKAHRIKMVVRDIESNRLKAYGDHVFSVFGLKKGAKPDYPNTWGNKAVVVDTWANRVMPANEAIDYYKSKLGFNIEKHNVDFFLGDRFPIE